MRKPETANAEGAGAATVQAGGWRVWFARDAGGAGAARWIALVEDLEAGAPPVHRSKHATTYRALSPAGVTFVKVYGRYRWRTMLKDLWRPSKASNARRMSAALAAAGFRVPAMLAAGERRRGLAVHAWTATTALDGAPLADHLDALTRRPSPAERAATSGEGAAPARERATPTGEGAARVAASGERDAGGTAPGGSEAALARKRHLLAALGSEAARLHELGFVAGDLVPANVWVVDGAGLPALVFLDHDRTRRGQPPAPWWRARRNLVQLNRMVLRGVTATDRLRVYRAYVARRGWSAHVARRRARWVIRKTIERRHRFDRVPRRPGVGFRELMRADGPYAPCGAGGARGEARR